MTKEEVSGYRALAMAIVEDAVNEWSLLCKDVDAKSIGSIEALRAFFRSDYCSVLLTGTDIDNEGLLNRLEHRLTYAEGFNYEKWKRAKKRSIASQSSSLEKNYTAWNVASRTQKESQTTPTTKSSNYVVSWISSNT